MCGVPATNSLKTEQIQSLDQAHERRHLAHTLSSKAHCGDGNTAPSSAALPITSRKRRVLTTPPDDDSSSQQDQIYHLSTLLCADVSSARLKRWCPRPATRRTVRLESWEPSEILPEHLGLGYA
jgi:hypothetical protein